MLGSRVVAPALVTPAPRGMDRSRTRCRPLPRSEDVAGWFGSRVVVLPPVMRASEAGEAVLPLGAFGVPDGAFDDALEVAGADLGAVRGGDLHAQGDDAGLGDRPPGQRRPVCGGLLPAYRAHGHAVADLDARRGVVGERHACDAGRGGDWLAVVGDGDGDGASVLVAGVESDVGDPAVGEVEADGRLGDVAESVEGHFPVPFVRSLRWAMASRRRRRASSPEVSAAASLAVASAVCAGWGSRMSATASSASVMSVTRLAT